MNKKDKSFQEELDYLKTIAPNERRGAFLTYCKEKIEAEENKDLSIEEASNMVCGACNLYFEETMPEFEEVMNIACDLEIDKNFRDRPLSDWENLKKIVKNKI